MSDLRPDSISASTLPEPQAMVQPERAVAGVEMEIGVARRPNHRGAVRRHRAEPTPECRLGEIAAAREQLGERMIERRAPRGVELVE
jgi:hypothetical protein